MMTTQGLNSKMTLKQGSTSTVASGRTGRRETLMARTRTSTRKITRKRLKKRKRRV